MDSSSQPHPGPSRQTALISGGCGGLAQAISHHLRLSGWEVFQPGRQELDVQDPASIHRYVQALPSPVDLLINNAAIVQDRLFPRIDPPAWDAVIDTNLTGAFRLTQAILPGMLRQGAGHLLQIGSFSALLPPAGQANYASAKAALIAFTQSLAAEYGPQNLRANCLLPGFLLTKMTASLPAPEVERIRQRHVLGRFNTPEDVARFIECLHAMAHVSGQVFQLDSRLHPWT